MFCILKEVANLYEVHKDHKSQQIFCDILCRICRVLVTVSCTLLCLSFPLYALSGCDQWPDSVGHGTFSSGRNATIRGRIWQNPKGGSGGSGGSCCALLVCFILAPAKLSDFT